ncbi:26461_t:CDS:1, partial [Racocetra persica]
KGSGFGQFITGSLRTRCCTKCLLFVNIDWKYATSIHNLLNIATEAEN